MTTKKIKANTVLNFTSTMNALLSSGLSIQDALIIAEESTRDKKTKGFIRDIYRRVKSGKSLTESLMYYKSSLESVYLMLVNIAERTGMVEDVFDKLFIYLKEKKDRKQKLAQALWYPALVFVAMVCVLFVIITYVFPKMQGIFDALGDGSGSDGNSFASLVSGLRIFSIVLLSLIAVIAIAVVFYKHNKRVKYAIDKAIYKTPIINNIRMPFDICDFCFAMKLLLSSSVPADDAVELSISGIKNAYFEECIKKVNVNIRKGLSFKESFEDTKFFPPYFITWLSINETSSDMGETFNNLYNFYKTKSDNILTMVSKSLEPLMTVLTGVFVIIFVMKFIVPMFDMLGNVG